MPGPAGWKAIPSACIDPSIPYPVFPRSAFMYSLLMLCVVGDTSGIWLGDCQLLVAGDLMGELSSFNGALLVGCAMGGW